MWLSWIYEMEIWKTALTACLYVSLKKDPLETTVFFSHGFCQPWAEPWPELWSRGEVLQVVRGSKALCCRHRLQISAFVTNNYFKLQRNALVAVDDEVPGGGCRDRDICHSSQSLTPVIMELSKSWPVNANIQTQNWVTSVLPVSVCALSPGKMQGWFNKVCFSGVALPLSFPWY